MKLDFNYCFLTRCPFDDSFCRTVQSWNSRSADRPDYSNMYCAPDAIPVDPRTEATECRHKKKDSTWLNYRGDKSNTMSGCTCLRWEDQTTTQHHFYPEAYPTLSWTPTTAATPTWTRMVPGASQTTSAVPAAGIAAPYPSVLLQYPSPNTPLCATPFLKQSLP